MEDYILTIDTSSGLSKIAIESYNNSVELSSFVTNMQAEQVAVLLDTLLKQFNIHFSQIKQINCVIGPGSFTGIRTSVSLIKGLTIGNNNIKINPVPSFYVFLSNYMDLFNKYKVAHILIDCGKNKSQCYYMSIDKSFAPINQMAILSYDELEDKISDNDFVVGNIDKNFFNKGSYNYTSYRELNISDLCQLGLLSDYYKFEPLYISPTYATIKN